MVKVRVKSIANIAESTRLLRSKRMSTALSPEMSIADNVAISWKEILAQMQLTGPG